MKRELEKFGNEIEAVADKLFNHRLQLAEREFKEIIDQVLGLDISKLPINMVITIDGVDLRSLEFIPGDRIPKHAHSMESPDNPKHVIHYVDKGLLPDQSFYIMLLPEILGDDSVGLTVGLIKHDGKQFFTGWHDSHSDLSARRYKGFKNYVALVQYNSVPDLDTYDLLDMDNTYGAAYLFSYAVPIKSPEMNLLRSQSFT